MNFTDQNFKQQVIQSKLPVVIDFWAEWCQPCKMVSPVIDALAKQYEGKVLIGKLNVDDNPETANKFGVMSIPTILIFKDGKMQESLIGVQSKITYKERVDKLLLS